GNLFGWRSASALVAGLGVLTVIMFAGGVPRVSVGAGEVPSARREIKAPGRVQILLTLLGGSVGCGGMFAVYTYITPTMTEIASVPSVAIPWVLAVYGLGMTAGSLIAGPLVDKSIERSATGGMILSALVLAAFGAFTHIAAVAIIALFLIGVSGSMITTALQMRLFRESQEAPSLSAAMNHAAFNPANAIGAWLGGIVITARLGCRAPAWVGVGLCLAGLIVISVAIFLRRGGSSRPSGRPLAASSAPSCRVPAAASQPLRTTGLHQRSLPRHRSGSETPGRAQWSRRSTVVSTLHRGARSGLDAPPLSRRGSAQEVVVFGYFWAARASEHDQ